MSCNPSGPIWLFQLWLQVYFLELGPANVTFRDVHRGRLVTYPCAEIIATRVIWSWTFLASPHWRPRKNDENFGQGTITLAATRFTILLPLVVRWVLFRVFHLPWLTPTTIFPHGEYLLREQARLGEGKYQPLGFPNLLRSMWRGSSGLTLALPLITVLSKPQKRQMPTLVIVKVRTGHFPPPKMLGRIETPPATMLRFHQLMTSSLLDRERSRGTYCPQEFQSPIFETEVSGQTATAEAEVETEVIGANLSTNPDVIMVKTQQVTQPSRSREVDHEIIDDPSHILDHQIGSSNFTKSLLGSPRPDRLFHRWSNSSGWRTYYARSLFVRACTAGALVESGSEQPLSTYQDDLIQSLLDHAPGDIFAYLDQWDASATTVEASTCHATSSTVAGVLPNPTAEALIRSYKN
ncbi:unnamed protein product [Prunus armeniaca]